MRAYWLRLVFRLRSAAYRVCCWLFWEFAEIGDYLVLPYEHPLPTLRGMWRDWRGLRGELSAQLDIEYSREEPAEWVHSLRDWYTTQESHEYWSGEEYDDWTLSATESRDSTEISAGEAPG